MEVTKVSLLIATIHNLTNFLRNERVPSMK